jgi:single-strand DNA-binding protein
MASRSLNKIQLIGNLTRDPELRYTPQGTAVCTFGLATNRSWVTEGNEKREETEFHRLVSWNKLAEICSQFLFKGRRIYVEGRIQTRQWTAQDGSPRQTTEVVVGEMIILDSRRAEDRPGAAPAPGPGSAGNLSVDAVVGGQAQPQGAAQANSVQPDDQGQSGKAKSDVHGKSPADDQQKAADKPEDKAEKEDEIDKDEIPF